MRECIIPSVLLLFLWLPVPASAGTTIIVDSGPFPTAQAAAQAEEQVNWLDADRADDAACTQCFAALELQRYLRRMTGRADDFAVADHAHAPPSGDVIVVGWPAAPSVRAVVDALGVTPRQLAPLGPEGYRIKSAVANGRRLLVVAGLERVGTLYGAYDLLYRLGCRWFAPGDLHEDVPRLNTLPDLDVTGRPSFIARGFLAWENRGDKEFLLWMARNRLDYMHVTTARWGSKALTNYQMARQLWDVQTDCEALWSDYFARRYGPAAGTMRRFYQSLEQMLSNANELKYGLARRLDRGAGDLFPDAHLRYDRQPGLECEGPTLLEIVEHGKRCRQLLAEARAMSLPLVVKARITEDEQCFTYGERTVAYYHACVRAFQEVRAGRRDSARSHYAEAQRLADLLRRDTVSSQGSSSHASAENAFVATLATHAPERLAWSIEFWFLQVGPNP